MKTASQIAGHMIARKFHDVLGSEIPVEQAQDLAFELMWEFAEERLERAVELVRGGHGPEAVLALKSRRPL